MLEAGLTRILLRKEAGGYALGFDTWAPGHPRTVQGPRLAWFTRKPDQQSFAGAVPEAAQKALWAGGLDVPIAVSLVLVVQATAVDGAIAFPVKGLPFVGGIDHCSWAAY